MVRLFIALPILFFATFAVAQLTITNPSSTSWWVGKSSNVLAWTCSTSPFSNFTVLINNTNPTILSGNLAFLAVQENDDCSINITPDQVSEPAAPGYTLMFANPLNETDIYAASELFEIKPLGSLYPSQVSSTSPIPSGTATATGSGSSTSASASPTSAAALNAHNPGFVGLAGVIGLLAVSLLGA